MAAKTKAEQRKPFWQILLLGKGSPRLRIKGILAAGLWGALIWLIYPYALSIARWPSTMRFIGVALLALCAFLIVLLLRSTGRVIWHLGLLWLAIVALALFGGMSLARGRSVGASTPADWAVSAQAVSSDIGRSARDFLAVGALLPGDLYTAVSGQVPFWWSKPSATLEPMTLEPVSKSDDLVLSSEQNPQVLRRGSLVGTHTDAGEDVRLRSAPGVDSSSVGGVKAGAIVIITEGPRLVGDQVWWQVSDTEQEGWCLGELLVLVSR